MKNIGIFVDGLVVPPREGINVHVTEIANYLAEHTDWTISLLICDRGWASKKILSRQHYNSILLSPQKFYSQKSISSVLSKYNIEIVQTHSPTYTVDILGPLCQKLKIKLLLEFHDIEEDLAKFLKLPEKEILYQKN